MIFNALNTLNKNSNFFNCSSHSVFPNVGYRLFGVLAIFLFFGLCDSLLAHENTINFKNFSETVTLEVLNEDMYRVGGSVLELKIAPRLVTKLAKDVSNRDLLELLPDAVAVEELFLMKEYRYVLIRFSDKEKSLKAMPVLQRQPFVLLVQPDLQQRRNKSDAELESSEEESAAEILPKYISIAKNKGLWPGNGGRGVTVAVIDDGFYLSHSEFDGLNTKFYYSFQTRSFVGNSFQKDKKNHGTKVAGILFAAINGINPEGLVPNASFVGIGQVDTWTSQTLQSFYLARLAEADIINCSWHSRWLLEPIQDVVDELSANGRDGKGTVVVFSAGNESRYITPGIHEASIASAIVVGATDDRGRRMPFSNFGSAVTVWAYGKGTKSTSGNGEYSNFMGTSLSSAVVSGYIGLLLGNEPSLSLSDVSKKLRNMLD